MVIGLLVGNNSRYLRISDLYQRRQNTEREDTYRANQDTAYFTIRGVALGTVSLTFSASITGKGSVTSEPKDVQVGCTFKHTLWPQCRSLGHLSNN